MKTILNKVVAAFIAMSVCFTIASCEKENGGEAIDSNALKEIEANYSITLSEDYQYFYDISVKYGYDEAELTSEIDGGWTYHETYSTDYVDPLPTRFFCTIEATPKSPVPAIDESKLYTFEYSCVCNIEGRTKDGSTIMKKMTPTNGKISCKGSKVQDALKKGTVTFISFEYERE